LSAQGAKPGSSIAAMWRDINAGERRLVLLSAACFFCVLTSYYILRPIREQYASAAGGSQALPELFLNVFVVMLLLSPVFGALFTRFPRRVFVPVIYAFFCVCMAVIAWLVTQPIDVKAMAKIYYVWLSVFNLFVVSVFWSCMADVFDVQAAKRVFGMVALGGTIGAIAGPNIAALLVKPLGLSGMCLVALGFLFAALLLLLALFNQRQANSSAKNEQVIGGSMWAGAVITFSDPLLRRMALLLLCADAISSVLYSLQLDYAQKFANEAARTQFFAWVDAITNSTQVLLQIFVVRFMLSRYGAGRAMSIPYLLNAVAFLMISVIAAPILVSVGLILSRGVGYGLVNPARESIFTHVDREARFKAKNFIDTVVWRGGDLLSITLTAWMVSQGATLTHFALVCALFALLAAGLSWRIEKLYPNQDPR
jgi:ATP:ADP antiporter, AAA family